MKSIFASFALLVLAFSCQTATEKTKQIINKGGEVAGKTATEFVEGVTEGIDRTLQCQVEVSERLAKLGIQTGKFSIESDSASGKNNVLVVYLIFNQSYSGTILAKASDKNGLECGRSAQKISAMAGEARFFDFKFDSRTDIEVKSKIQLD